MFHLQAKLMERKKDNMESLHILEPGREKIYFDIVQVGAGANGGQFFRSLCQDIATHFRSFNENKQEVTFGVNMLLCDADRYEDHNLSNQLCTQEDIGEFKVDALKERYEEVYGLSIGSIPRYVKTKEMIDQLFSDKGISDKYQTVKILVGMIDNNKTRQLFHDYFYSDDIENLIWIDAGVTGVNISSSDSKVIRESGFSGQVVVGFKYRGRVILKPVTDVFPEMLEDAKSSFPDESCGELIINNPQRSATNRMAATIANNVMNNLFHSQRIYSHIINFNAQTCMSGGRTGSITEEHTSMFNDLKSIEE